jgi:undecaprenyl diphosphate synthase
MFHSQEQEPVDQFKLTKPLNHIAFIMDGNGRWAKEHMLPRSMGHKAGVRNIKQIVDLCFKKYGIKYCSLFVFSTENWNRPEKEIAYLFKLLEIFFRDNIDQYLKDGTKILVSGDLSDPRIPPQTLETIKKAIEETKDCKNYVFNVLFNYGGRRELVNAAQKIAQEVKAGTLEAEKIDENTLKDHLYQKDVPDVDLLVRTSGEVRISNCMLYELAYAEMVFPVTYWPAFTEYDLIACLREYEKRNRRYGGLKNE